MDEITVRGAGILGLSIAWICVTRGARVQVVDPFGPSAGSSGGIVGALAPHVPENWNPKKAFQLESLLMTPAFWSVVEEAGGISPGYAPNGRLQPIADESALALARHREETARTLWQGKAKWAVIPATDEPWSPPSPSGWLIYDTLSAHMHPRQACAALVAALASRGVSIQTDAPDRGHVVWATGYNGLQTLNKTHTRTVGTGVKGQAALLRMDVHGVPQIFVDGVHVIPHMDGTVAIGSTSDFC